MFIVEGVKDPSCLDSDSEGIGRYIEEFGYPGSDCRVVSVMSTTILCSLALSSDS